MTNRVKSKGVRVQEQKKNSHTALTDFFFIIVFLYRVSTDFACTIEICGMILVACAHVHSTKFNARQFFMVTVINDLALA